MAHFRHVLSLAFLLCLATPLTAAAEESTSRYVFVPPGHTTVKKWVVDELPGQTFDRKADAIAAAFNANLMSMHFRTVTTVIPPADAPSASATTGNTVAAR